MQQVHSRRQYTNINIATQSKIPTFFHYCITLNLLFRFDYRDIKMFHSIVYGLSTVQFPNYSKPFGGPRLRNSHLDHRCYTCTITPSNIYKYRNYVMNSISILYQSFFYRAHLIWNRLPLGQVNSKPSSLRICGSMIQRQNMKTV